MGRFGPAFALLILCSILLMSYGATTQGASVSTEPREGVAVAVGSISGHTEPMIIQASRADRWSTIAYFDLTEAEDIPPHAIVTGITVTGDASGRFASPRRAVVDEKGDRAVVHAFTGRTTEHNGKPVRQRWAVQFATSTIWEGPAMLRPVVTVHYEY